MKKKPTKVVLVDDHDMVRAGIRSILERTEEIEVIGEARDGLEAMDLVQELVPDIVLLDVEMPRMSGRRVAQELRERELPVRVIALSAYDDNQYILGMLSRGVAGYLTKDEVPNLLIHAIRGVANGEEGWVSNRVAERIASWSRFGKADRATLTNIELRILGMIADKKNDTEIARELGVEVNVVKKHIERLCDKFQAVSRIDLAVRAREEGLV
jgi:DNA-binding NarL/FixJ family response regulator